MAEHPLIVVGASAGAFESLRTLARMLPQGFPAAILVVVHLSSTRTSNVPQLLAAAGPLPAVHVRDPVRWKPGTIYVAPPNHHVEVTRDELRLDPGPRENGFRPSIDFTFRTAALTVGSRTIGVILSGMRDDGTEGLRLIKRCGGIAIVQDPDEALFPSMPCSAIDNVAVDRVVRVEELANVLQLLVTAQPQSGEVPLSVESSNREEGEDDPQVDKVFVCPDCGGVVREVHEDGLVRYRCRVGHAYNPETFVEMHAQGVEEALWYAVNALSERKSLTLGMARRARASGRAEMATRYEALAHDAELRAEAIRRVLLPAAVEESIPGRRA